MARADGAEGEAMKRAHMSRAAFALLEFTKNTRVGAVEAAEVVEISVGNTRYAWSTKESVGWVSACLLEASLLMSESERPQGHDGEDSET
jgi:hypothetical protein